MAQYRFSASPNAVLLHQLENAIDITAVISGLSLESFLGMTEVIKISHKEI